MSKLLNGGIAFAAIVTATLAGYRLGGGKWPESLTWTSPSRPSGTAMPAAEPSERKVLYWRHPDSETDFSAEPKKTGDGRDYKPVYDNEEANFAQAQSKEPSKSTEGGPKKLLFYRNPMGLPDTSREPKKDWMGMDYIPVYEGEDDDAGTVKISVAKLQRSGVRSEPAALRRLVRPIRAPGVAKPDERTLYTVALRADSFIEKLYVNETGRQVKMGEPLFQVYSPKFLRALIEDRNDSAQGVVANSQVLEVLQVPPAIVTENRKAKKVVSSFDYPSPVSGVVMEKMVVEGMMMKMGEPMFKIADLSKIWVIADVPEQEIGQIQIGSSALVRFRAFAGETFKGRVTFILNELAMATRTAKVRIEISNPDHRIKHEMFADVEINASEGEPERLVVPVSALIDSGNRQVVIVDRGEGRFEPRPVKVGMRGDGYVEIADGIKVGENVVVAANFLIDAESNLKAALSGFTEPTKGEPTGPATMEKKP